MKILQYCKQLFKPKPKLLGWMVGWYSEEWPGMYLSSLHYIEAYTKEEAKAIHLKMHPQRYVTDIFYWPYCGSNLD